MARSKKKPASPAKKNEVPEQKSPEGSDADPQAPDEPVIYQREDEKRSADEEKAMRTLLKKADKALDAIVDVLGAFEPAPERSVKNALKRLRDEVASLKPPEPRKCKEYKRALMLARKGEMGIHPDDVMRYCRCTECHSLRDQVGLSHPLPPRAA